MRSLLCQDTTKVHYVIDSIAHLGRFLLIERPADGGSPTIWLEGPDGRVFRPSDLLPVLSGQGTPVTLTGADVVLAWVVQPRRTLAEIKLGLSYLSQWPEGPQARLTRLKRE